MQKTITVHRLDEAKKAAADCVHFGFCTAVCPTYVLDGEENDSPRGRIAFAREMLASNAPPRPEAVLHLDRCLSCLSCQTTCAADVQYRDIIDAAREYIENSGVRPWYERMFRSSLAKVLTTPSLLRPLLYAAPVAAALKPLLPAPLGALGALSSAPAIQGLRSRKDLPLPPNPESPVHKVLLVTGCVQSVTGGEINAAAVRFLRRFGVDVVLTADHDCCGALDLHMGRQAKAESHATRRVREWAGLLASGQINAIVTTTSGCGSVIRHYDELLARQPDLQPQVAMVLAAIRDITEMAESLDWQPDGRAMGLTVAYHDACSMKHGQKLTRAPRKVMKRSGMQVADIAESHLCCGSAGTYNILQPAIAQRLGQRKAQHAEASNPDVIAAANLGCLVQISRFSNTPVAHTVQLLDWATGGPAPRGLESYVPRLPNSEPETGSEPLAPTAVGSTEDALW